MLPLMVMGALAGAAFAQGAGAAMGFAEYHASSFVLLGMAGCFSAAAQAQVTAVILMCELSGGFNELLSLSVVAVVSYITADLLKGCSLLDLRV